MSEAAPRPELESSTPLAERALEAAKGFRIRGELAGLRAFERGHIHDTFVSSWRVGEELQRYLHQRINREVFRDVDGLMHNIRAITSHLGAKLGEPNDAEAFRTLQLVQAHDGGSYLVDSAGGAWRTYEYIEESESHDACENREQAYEAARVFGRFQELLSDIDVSGLRETIPNFFSSPHRLFQLEAAIGEDRAGRRESVQADIDFVLARRDLVRSIDALLRDGVVPQRVVHGDTKLNNVLFHRETRAALAVVDLDTCMPGYSLYDFGDLVRFTAATSAEDEGDLECVGTDLELYAALVDGYLEHAADFLTERERLLMPLAARLVTLTIGMRFLADHLNGDVYFKTHRENHNLDRARVQFGMVAFMEKHDDVMQKAVRPKS